MKKLLITTLCSLSLAAYGQSDILLAEYKNGKIYQAEVQRKLDIMTNRNLNNKVMEFDKLDKITKQNLVTNIIATDILAKEAKSRQLHMTPAYQAQLKEVELQLLQQALIEQVVSKEITEAKLKAKYSDFVQEFKKQDKEEVHASHILVATEGEALTIIQQIKEGKAFADLAKERSKDQTNSAKGGDLGYFTRGQMVKPFEDAAFSLTKKGEISQPVKTDFGWHVIELHEKRKMPAPAYDVVKDALRMELIRELAQHYIDGKLKEANIQFKFQ